MTGHAREASPQGAPPAAICPSIEVLVHRRATELITEQPRRRRITAWSSVGGVAVAALCAVLVLVLGSPSGGGLLTPRQAVAAVVSSLNGDGVLHWMREGDLVESPGQAERPGTIAEEEWTDLATGDSHRIATRTPSDGPSERRLTWWTADARWVAVPEAAGGPLAITREPLPDDRDVLTAVEQIRALLHAAEQGRAEIATGGTDDGRPLVVVTERADSVVRRVWITREEQPQMVRSETTFLSRNAPRPIVTTTTTKTWNIRPRTPEALADVEIPSTAKRVP